MSIQSQLIQIIKTALTSHDNLARSQAENQIIMYKDNNPSEFFFNCAQILQNQNNDDFIRQSAGTVVSRLLITKNMNSGKFSWDEIYQEQKSQIRQKVISVLISPKAEVMKAGASVIAAIASIDLPKGQWENIVDVLAENCSNSDVNFKNASITTLGFICEQIKNMGQRINDRLSEQILGSIIVGTRQSQSNIIQTSLKALEDSLFFLEPMMANPVYRNTVFEVFINNFKNDIFVERTYRALFEFVRAASPYLGCYTKELTDLTQIHLEKRNGTSILNLEMWEIIGSGYAEKFIRTKDRVNQVKQQDNFLQSVSEQVIPHIMKCLVILHKKEQDQQEFRNSASKALESFVKVCDKSVVDTISTSVASIIDSQDPYYQQASVPLFSTICEYSDYDYVAEMFRNGFQHLFRLLNSQSKVVVKNSLVGFVRLSEAFPEVFLLHKNVEQIISTIFNFVNVELQDIRIISVVILLNISEGIKQNPQPVADDPNILLTKVVNYFTENKLKLLEEQVDVNEKLAAIIMNIVMISNNTNVIVHLIQFMIDEYYKLINLSTPNINLLFDLIISILHTSLLAYKNTIPSNQLLVKLCQLANFHIKKFGIEAQGLSILGAIATSFSKYFQGRIQNYLPGVKKALQNPNDIATYKNALACIGDFSRVMETGFFNHASQIINSLLQNVKQSYDRDIKLSILNCIGDLVLCLQQNAVNHLQDILKIMDLCFSATYQLLNNDKDIQYVQDLKTSLIELYSCITFALSKNPTARRLFSNHFGLLATFIVRTCDKTLNPTVDYLKSCVYLIHDIAAFLNSNNQFRQNVRVIINSKQIQQLQNMLTKYHDSPQIKELFNFIESTKKK